MDYTATEEEELKTITFPFYSICTDEARLAIAASVIPSRPLVPY
jgi:hypothetical protein